MAASGGEIGPVNLLPAAVIEGTESLGFHITHVYGLTEVYGPAVVCGWHDEWNELPAAERARFKARQGVAYPVLDDLMVADPASLAPVPADGATMGEIESCSLGEKRADGVLGASHNAPPLSEMRHDFPGKQRHRLLHKRGVQPADPLKPSNRCQTGRQNSRPGREPHRATFRSCGESG